MQLVVVVVVIVVVVSSARLALWVVRVVGGVLLFECAFALSADERDAAVDVFVCDLYVVVTPGLPRVLGVLSEERAGERVKTRRGERGEVERGWRTRLCSSL